MLTLLGSHSFKEFAKYLDWWERTGVYRDGNESKTRKNREIRCLIRRFGLDDDDVTPSPEEFLTISAQTSLIWTETHQWLYLLRFFDVLADLRGVRDPIVDRVSLNFEHLVTLSAAT